jgi:probable F420-dependent oxidoreductase
MRFGLYAINYGTCADPEALVRVSRYAESAGLDSVWAGEHLALPHPQGDYVIAPEIPFLDALIALTLAAAETSTLRVGTAILELPLHNPVLLAKQLASIDQIARGRLSVGVGVGYLPIEFHALGVPLDERATRTDEFIAAMRELWLSEAPEYHGRHVDFAGIDAHPRPVQAGGPPIYIGGNSVLARRRAVTSARGWLPADLDVEQLRAACIDLDRQLADLDRPSELGEFDLTVISPDNKPDRAMIEGYRACGVHRVIVLPGLDVPRERRYHDVPIVDIMRSIDHLATFID